jgi:hypothetical protein
MWRTPLLPYLQTLAAGIGIIILFSFLSSQLITYFPRLFKYDPVHKTNKMLVDKINFANGLALSPNEDFIVVSETVTCRLLR